MEDSLSKDGRQAPGSAAGITNAEVAPVSTDVAGTEDARGAEAANGIASGSAAGSAATSAAEGAEDHAAAEARREMEALAQHVLELSRNAVLVNLRFMEQAYALLPPRLSQRWKFAVDGSSLRYQPRYVLKAYAAEPNALARDVLHAALHCVFQHPFVGEPVIPAYWDLACDVAVESVIGELDLAATRAERSVRQQSLLARIKAETNLLTAEKVYRCLLDSGMTEDEAKEARRPFFADEHEIWYQPASVSTDEKHQEQRAEAPAPEGTQRAERKAQEHAGTKTSQKAKDREHREKSKQLQAPTTQKNEPKDAHEAIGGRFADTIGLDRAREDWEKAAYQMGVELESFARMWGTEGAGLVATLKAVTREKQDYSEFLRKFATRNEEIKVNDDEFDYIYYCYGLALYENVPLIEPLEYVDEKKVRDFVIAIDTSASTSGELVHKFVTKTYNILQESQSFSTKLNLYIIQADAEIADVAHITSKKEFERYMDGLEVHGMGGTDFRPVFSFVDNLVETRAVENLGGLVYFTDGQGTYPAKKPDYDVAFVFVDDAFAEHLVPSWAMKVLLQSEDIRKFEED